MPDSKIFLQNSPLSLFFEDFVDKSYNFTSTIRKWLHCQIGNQIYKQSDIK